MSFAADYFSCWMLMSLACIGCLGGYNQTGASSFQVSVGSGTPSRYLCGKRTERIRLTGPLIYVSSITKSFTLPCFGFRLSRIMICINIPTSPTPTSPPCTAFLCYPWKYCTIFVSRYTPAMIKVFAVMNDYAVHHPWPLPHVYETNTDMLSLLLQCSANQRKKSTNVLQYSFVERPFLPKLNSSTNA